MLQKQQHRYQETIQQQESPLTFLKIKQKSVSKQPQIQILPDITQMSQSISNDSQGSSLRSSRSWYVSSSSEEYQIGQIDQTPQINQIVLQPQYCISPKHQNSNSVVIKNIPHNYNHLLDGFLMSEDDIQTSKTSSMASHLRSISEDQNIHISTQHSKKFPSNVEDSESSYSDFSNASIQKSCMKQIGQKIVGSQASTSSGGFQIIIEKAKSSAVEHISVRESPVESSSPQQTKKQTQEEQKKQGNQVDEQRFSTIYTVLSSDSSYKFSQIQESDTKGLQQTNQSIEDQKQQTQSEPTESEQNKSMKVQEFLTQDLTENTKENQSPQIYNQTTNQTTSITQITLEPQETSANKSQLNLEVQTTECKESASNQTKINGQYFDCRPSLMYCSQCQTVVQIQLYQETQETYKSTLMQIIFGVLCCFNSKLNQAVYRCTECKKLLATVPRNCQFF